MSSRRNRYLLMILAAASIPLSIGIACFAVPGPSSAEESTPVGRPARIQPDYADTVIPPNIAPLNFVIRETGSRYVVRIKSEQGVPIEIPSRTPKIAIPAKPWRWLLSANRGRELSVEVLVQVGDRWRQFDVLRMKIANEEIDRYLAYRRIHPAHSAWRDMGIYQRDLQSFDESPILTNDYFRGGCVNCHTFCNNRTDMMLVSTRSGDYGNSAVIVKDGAPEKVGATFGYASWHPGGKILVYTSMKVAMFLHPAGEEVRDVIDLDSLLAYYNRESQQVKTAPDLAKKDRLETYPTWSPDGRYLYFCSAPLTWTSRTTIPERYDEIRYDLVRIPYDADNDTWGRAETVLFAREAGRSILLPRISPDGRWLLLAMCDYGCFPVYRKSSDLYLIDLAAAAQTGRYEYRRLAINSDQSESWHSWSSNGRWIAFSSKRGNGTFTRTYLSYVDRDGVAYKPLVVPQKDPAHYDSCLWTYSVPELVTQPVPATKETLGRVVRSTRRISVELPITTATPRADQPPQPDDPYRSTRQ